MMSSKPFSALKPRLSARLASSLRAQPSTILMITGSGSRRMRSATLSPATRLSAAICSATVTDRPGMLRLRRCPTRAVSIVAAWMRKLTAERGDACQWRTSSATGSTACCPASGSRVMPPKKAPAALLGFPGRLPGERLADDAREEARGRLVGLARPHADRRQPDADAVEEAAPRVIGEQELTDRLLGAVARQRRCEELVADRLREGRAEDRDRRGEDEPRPVAVADVADGVEELARAVEIDAVALVEVGLGLARHDRREMEDDVRPLGDELLGLAGLGEVRRDGADLERRVRRRLRLDDVVQRRLGDLAPAEPAVLRQPVRELAPDHAGGAEREG